MQSLSAYARQFLGMQDKPDVDDIAGLSPAISIEQRGSSHNPRSTVGTVTEIYDHLRLVYGRIGIPHCPSCGKEVHRYSLDEIVDLLYREYRDLPLEILAPLIRGKKGEYRNLFLRLRQQGYLRVRVDGVVYWLEEEIDLDKNKRHFIEVVVDRLRVTDDHRDRIAEAVETALKLAEGFVLLHSEGKEDLQLTENYICPDCQISLPEIEPRLFSFNNPYGACEDCSGLGVHEYFSEDLAVVPELSVLQGAFIPWRNKRYMVEKIESLAALKGWDLTPPFKDLPLEIQQILLWGTDERVPMLFKDGDPDSQYMGRIEGLLPWLERQWRETDSEARREELSQYRAEDICQSCGGKRLKPEALAVTVGGYSIDQIVSLPIEELLSVIRGWELSKTEKGIVGQVVDEILKRLSFIDDVGAGYLSLGRRADSLSGGESQRIHLATQLGSKLTGVLYVLDEPTIGLHPRDTAKLLQTLKVIRDLGNSVLVVEHDRDTMLAADHIIELGPGAGENGGQVVAQGGPEEIKAASSLSGPYLKGYAYGAVLLPRKKRRKPASWIKISGACEHNLKNIDVKLPLGVLGAISGVSGSGKSTLLYEILYKGLRRKLDPDFREHPGKFKELLGEENLRNVVLIDQSPIGRTPRSNPATYTGVFSFIRELFAELPESKMRGYLPGRFSFNVRGGRCEACGGDGVRRVSMLFLPDVYVACDVCKGRRYNKETLDIRFKGLNIADVLELTVDDALELFKDIPKIAHKLSVIQEAGLGYIRLGQPAPTLSGGEAQRVKLATELSKRFRGNTLYLLDEPTTGLHYTDVQKLLRLLHKLVEQGNSVLVIEHNLDVLASCDYVIDLGPEGGNRGGEVVTQGTPEQVAASKKGFTALHLGGYLEEILKGGFNDNDREKR